jgi:cyclic pyranopterin phosphate synthase
MHNETLNPESVPLELTRFTPTSSRATSIHPTGTLVDKFGRRITYVRLSITDRCDFRCTYCMAEEMTFLPRTEVMSLEECLRLANVFVGLGVSKVRITGGEPLVRKDVLWLIECLAKLPGLDNLVITTNGSQLDRFAAPLKAAGVRRINVSLDTLEPQRFREITRIGDLEKVLRDDLRAAGYEEQDWSKDADKRIWSTRQTSLIQLGADPAIGTDGVPGPKTSSEIERLLGKKHGLWISRPGD